MKNLSFVGRSLLALALIPFLGACAHELVVKNLDAYTAPTHLQGGLDQPINVAILPFDGTPDQIFYFNALLDRINQSAEVNKVRTDYISEKKSDFHPDVILSINPSMTYRSSGLNFLINWPGFIVFTPEWYGYIYYADILTQVAIYDGNGKLVTEESIPVSYDIRQSELDRTIFSLLTWLEFSALAFGGGIYDAIVFDKDIIPELQNHVKNNYATYVGNAVRPKILAAAEASRLAAPTPPSQEPSPDGAPPVVEQAPEP